MGCALKFTEKLSFSVIWVILVHNWLICSKMLKNPGSPSHLGFKFNRGSMCIIVQVKKH